MFAAVDSDAKTIRVAQGKKDSRGVKLSFNVPECRSLLGQTRTHVGEKQDLVTVKLDVIPLQPCPAEHTFLVLIPEESDQDSSGMMSLWGEYTVHPV